MSEQGGNNTGNSRAGKPGSPRAAQALPLNAVEMLLADLVEAQPSAEQLAKLDPKARALLESLRRDRQILAGIPDQAAPAGMVDAVMARLERESLFEDPFAAQPAGTLLTAAEFERRLNAQELAEREALVGSAIDPALAGRIAPSTFKTRGMVAAAALLLIGGGLYLASLTISPATPAGPGPLAINDAGSQPTPEATHSTSTDTPTPAQTQPQAQTSTSPTLANNDKPVDAVPTRTLASAESATGRNAPSDERLEPGPTRVAAEIASANPKGPAGLSIAAALAAADRSRVIDGPDAPARALQAAREGRLIIRVRSGSPEIARTRLASVVDERQPESRTWQLSRATQPEIIAAATSAVPTLAERVQANQERLARAQLLASGNEAPQPALNIKTNGPAFDPRQNGGVFLLDVPATDDAISTARIVLAGVLLGQAPGLEPAADAIELVELENAIPALPSTQVEAVMWWTQPPRNWTAHASVPVVIEEN